MKLNQALPSTLDECLVFYLDHCLAHGQSDRTVETKESNLNMFIEWCKPKDVHLVKDIDKFVIEDYRGFLNKYRQPYNGNPLSKGTKRNRLTAVKTFLSKMYYFEAIDIDIASRFELPRAPKRLPMGFLSEAQAEQVFAQTLYYGLKGLRDRAILETYYATGIRRMELAYINIPDLDREKRILTVFKGKGDKERRVPIAERACLWIDFYLKEVRPKLATVKSSRTLFVDDIGLEFREQQLTRMVSKYVRRAGIKVRGACNLFRHSTATLMHENGADIRHVQEMLGHADISTTQIYTHVAIKKLVDVYLNTHPAAKHL
ncbi:MAG: tyrosine-type recombinase/integrase [Gammaproteobacteria bacterium]|nr:tyrosine-type recombinase/integrase [Gammaproteobacteria bacterium]